MAWSAAIPRRARAPGSRGLEHRRPQKPRHPRPDADAENDPGRRRGSQARPSVRDEAQDGGAGDRTTPAPRPYGLSTLRTLRAPRRGRGSGRGTRGARLPTASRSPAPRRERRRRGSVRDRNAVGQLAASWRPKQTVDSDAADAVERSERPGCPCLASRSAPLLPGLLVEQHQERECAVISPPPDPRRPPRSPPRYACAGRGRRVEPTPSSERAARSCAEKRLRRDEAAGSRNFRSGSCGTRSSG